MDPSHPWHSGAARPAQIGETFGAAPAQAQAPSEDQWARNGHGHSSRGGGQLEEIDDPSTLLSQPFVPLPLRPAQPGNAASPSSPASSSTPIDLTASPDNEHRSQAQARRKVQLQAAAAQSRSSEPHLSQVGMASAPFMGSGAASGSSMHNTASEAGTSARSRVLPPGFGGNASGSGGGIRPAPRGLSSSSGYVQQRAPSSSSGNQIWQPPPRPAGSSHVPNYGNGISAGVPTIVGGGARVPNVFLGSRSSGAASNHGGQGGMHPVMLSAAPSAHPSTSYNASSSSSNGQRPSGHEGAIDLTGDDDDEPILVASRPAGQEDIVIDEKRSNALVCAGVVHGVVLCMYGLPVQLTYRGDYNSDPPRDPAFDKRNWPGITSFWSEKGYRPVMISVSGPQLSARSAHGGWATAGRGAEVHVAVIKPPGPNEEGRMVGPRVMQPFGALADKYVKALGELLLMRTVQVETRCKLVTQGRASNFLHPVEMLIFTPRPKLGLVSESLSSAGISLEHPTSYNPSDYPHHPEYQNPHNPPVGGYMQDAHMRRALTSGIFGAGGMGSIVQSKEMSEEQKRKQVDSVYASLRSGDELEQVEPGPLIVTQLFPHQKQALAFLLLRERERSFDEEPQGGSGESSTLNGHQSNDKSKVRAKAEDEDGGTISLWRVVRGSNGRARSYENVVTNSVTQQEPTICRGAILADDMGLGKTITIIALIAHTQSEAITFGSSPLEPLPPDRRNAKNGAEDLTADDFGMMVYGQPPAKKSKGGKKGGKKEAKNKDAERARREALVTRSRATLIVCPLSIVSNWEEQIREHWSSKEQPSIYIYHGGSRLTDPRAIANHDIVLTTFATLGTEFANQRTWVQDDKDASSGSDDNHSDDEDDFQVVDALGRPIDVSGKQKKNKKKRKRQHEGTKEAPNALQRVEWFRVVLDEAHIIKEASTWQSKACCNLSAQRRTCLTGTPIQNRMDDLYAQIKFLRLDPFSERQVWSQHCGQRDHGASLRAKKNNGPNAEPLDTMALARVQTIMKFLTLRRTKETRTADGRTLLSLPPKYSRTCMLEFDEHEKAKYQALHMRYKSDFEDMVQNDTLTTNYATILHEILNLRLACDHPAMVDASKDAKRLKEGNADLSTAIREDGLNREKAIALFGVFRDMEAAMCSECGTDLSRTVETNGGMFMHGSAEELDGRLESAANGKGRKGVKKERAFDSSASTPSMRTGAQTPMSQDGEILPVVTKCQHLFCSPCFTRTVCPSWPSPKAGDRCGCSACGSMLSVAMDAFQLEPADFDTEGAGDELAHGGGSPSSEDSFDWGDGPEEDKKLPASASGAGGSSVDASKPSGRFEASTKIRALIADLIPFSQCNAHSKLYDPNAPRLDHWAPPPPTSADEGGSDSALQSDQPVRVVQCAPKSSVKGEGQTGDEDNDGPLPIKSVVFSQWTKMLDRIQAGLKRTGIRYRRLDGTMKRVDRGASLEAFKTDPGVEVLLVSLRAGGFGLNLVVACRAYLMDPYWNPAVENQGLDRIHRMGQTRPVITTKFIMSHSIEENMLALQARKTELAERIGQRRLPQTAAERKAERNDQLKLLFRTDMP